MPFLKKLFGKGKGRAVAETTEAEELRKFFEQRGLIASKKKEKAETFSEMTERIAERAMAASVAPDRKRGKMLLNALFLGMIRRSPEAFSPVRDAVSASNMKILPDTYASLMIAASIAGGIAGIAGAATYAVIFKPPLMTAALAVTLLPVAALVGTFGLFYLYPFSRLNQKKVDIEANLPFAINQMAAVAASGVPPYRMFELLVEFKEYGAVSEEAENIVKRVSGLGEDITVAIRAVADKTPSVSMKELLYGILAIIEGGGDIKSYLKEMASIALFNYKLARKRYLETLSTYADIYTAILIAAPLFLVATLAIINILPGATLAGLDVNTVMQIGTYLGIPAVNIIFIAFLALTQPKL